MTLNVGSLAAGTLEIGCQLPEIWPPQKDGLLIRHYLSDGGILRILVRTDCKLEVGLFRSDDYCLDAKTSPAVRIVDHRMIVILVTWLDSQFQNFCLDGVDVLRTQEAKEVTLTGTIDRVNMTDYSLASERALRDRFEKLERRRPKPDRKQGSESYMLSALSDEVQQMTDLISHIRDGREAHVPGLAARLRLLIADKPFSLLQHCAAFRKLPLIFYCGRFPERSSPANPAFEFRCLAAATIDDYYCNPVDLDVWLNFKAFEIEGEGYSHSQVIKAIGDTIGAHRDRDIDKLVSALQVFQSMPGNNYREINRYLLEVSEAVLSLAKYVLSQTR